MHRQNISAGYKYYFKRTIARRLKFLFKTKRCYKYQNKTLFEDFGTNKPCIEKFISVIENFTLSSGNETLCLKKLLQSVVSNYKNESLPESE